MSCALWRRILGARYQAQGYLYRSRSDVYDLLMQPGTTPTAPIAFTRRGGSARPCCWRFCYVSDVGQALKAQTSAQHWVHETRR